MRLFKNSSDEDITTDAIISGINQSLLTTYMIAQFSGVFNMYTEARTVMEITGLTPSQYKWILKNYGDLIEANPEAETNAKNILDAAGEPRDNTLLEKMLWLRKAISISISRRTS
jgi:hypothetical protein